MNTVNSCSRPSTTPPVQTVKYLTFALNDESFGIPVLAVREIIPIAQVTPVPRLPDYIEGVINLRGKIIPVLHLGLRFRFSRSEISDRTCIIIVQLKTESSAVAQCGLIVDAVEEVISIAGDQIEETPNFGSAIESSCIAGLVNIGGKVKTLLNVEKTVLSETPTELAA